MPKWKLPKIDGIEIGSTMMLSYAELRVLLRALAIYNEHLETEPKSARDEEQARCAELARRIMLTLPQAETFDA
jgi:hypothetical protein